MKRVDLSRRDLRLASGLVLFAYVALHFLTHALGLWSLELAEQALAASVAVWHSLPGTLLLLLAAALHLLLALLAVYERRTLRMPPMQAVRMAMGFAIPLLLVGHVAATRLAADLQGLAPTYTRIVWALWVSDGEGRQLALQAPGWVHGCLGLQFAFGRRALWQRLQPALLGAALLLPVLAALGFLAMGRELATQAGQPHWQVAAVAATPVQMAALGRLRDALLFGYLGLLGAVFAARALRGWVERQRRQLVSIRYPQRLVQVPRGWSVLEASRGFGIAHLSLCGGHARCSTCRVRVREGAAQLPPPNAQERHTLRRIQAEPDVRLACQLRPTDALSVEPLLDPVTAEDHERLGGLEVVDLEAALLFVRLVGWRRPGNELRSPHDLVFALNRWLAVVGDACAGAGALPGRFDNEGASATFGSGRDAASAAAAVHAALRAARAIERELARLNAALERELGLVADAVLVLHAGPVALGPVGYGRDRLRLPVGEAVREARALRDWALQQPPGGGFACVLSRTALERAAAAVVDVADPAWQAVPQAGVDVLVLESLAALPAP